MKNLSGRLGTETSAKRIAGQCGSFTNKVNLWCTRQLLIDVILSKSAALMLLVCQKPCNHVGSLRLLFCTQTASETTTHRHVRNSLAGFLRNDLGRHGSHHQQFRTRIIRHVAVFEPDRLLESFSSMWQQSCNWVATFITNGLQRVPAGLLSSCVILELSRKVVVKNCL